jgi:hypothetical protein
MQRTYKPYSKASRPSSAYALKEKHLYDLIPQEVILTAGLEFKRTTTFLVHRNYCKFLVLGGACTGKCSVDCKAVLIDAIKGIDPKVANNPAAVAAWRLKGARATMLERHAQTGKAPIVSDIGKSGLDALEAMFQ